MNRQPICTQLFYAGHLIRQALSTFALITMISHSPGALANTGLLRIATNPGDAQIFINGQRKGNSPTGDGQNLTIKLRAGEYTVEAIKPNGPTEQYGKTSIHVTDNNLQAIAITIDLTERPSASMRHRLMQKFVGRVPNIAMVTIPAGNFVMGSNKRDDERPPHMVKVKAFKMGKTEVTFDQWDACVANGGCDHLPNDEGWGRGNRPVVNVSWYDIQQYITWLNKASGKSYRLPSAAEWEYAARAGTTSDFSTGTCLSSAQANFDANSPGDACQKGEYRKQTVPVASFAPNAFGVYDTHGNVWEWVQDCWNSSYSDAPSDGSAYISGNCSLRVFRGGSWSYDAESARSARRDYLDRRYRYNYLGFRLNMSR